MGEGAGSSGEISSQTLLLQAVQDIRVEQRNFALVITEKLDRQNELFAAKLDKHNEQLSAIMVDLANGKGRMDGQDQRLDTVAGQVEENRQKLRGITSDAYKAATKADRKGEPTGGWVRLKDVSALVAALTALVIAIAAIVREREPPNTPAAQAPVAIPAPHGP